jgi:hypothetical protein
MPRLAMRLRAPFMASADAQSTFTEREPRGGDPLSQGRFGFNPRRECWSADATGAG